MTTFFKIAFRNVLRNRYRSFLTLLAITIGLTALIFVHSFIEGAIKQMVENYTDLISGHIQIHYKDFQTKMGLNRNIVNSDKIINELK